MFAIKELMRHMSAPTEQDEKQLKRAVRFVKTLPRLVARYPWKRRAECIEVYCDAGHAGCPVTRKSTLGGVVTWGGSYVKGWPKTMENTVLSLNEAE